MKIKIISDDETFTIQPEEKQITKEKIIMNTIKRFMESERNLLVISKEAE